MNYRHKRIFTIISVILVLLFILGSIMLPLLQANADSLSDLQEQYADLQKQQKEVLNKIQNNKDDQADTVSKKKDIDANITLVRSEIKVINSQITALDTRIDEKQQEMDKAQEKVDYNYSIFKERLRVIYMDSNMSFLDVLFSSNSLNDFLMKSQVLQSISVHDTKLLNELKNDINIVKSAKAAIESDKASVLKKQNSLNQKEEELNAQSAESASLLAKLKSDQKALEVQNAKIDSQEQAENSQIAKIILEQLSNGKSYDGVLDDSFMWPVQGMSTYISSTYGPRDGHSYPHTGIDIAGSEIYGHEISAAADGEVIYAGYDSIYGNCVILNNGKNSDGDYVLTMYAHATSIAAGIAVGASVKQGQTLSYAGSTGNSTGPHLHFQVMICSQKLLEDNKGKANLVDLKIDVNPLNFTYLKQNCTNASYYRIHGNQGRDYIVSNW